MINSLNLSSLVLKSSSIIADVLSIGDKFLALPIASGKLNAPNGIIGYVFRVIVLSLPATLTLALPLPMLALP